MEKLIKTVVVASFAGVLQATAEVCIWSGDENGNGNWSEPTYWIGGAAPKTGDSIVIPASTKERMIVNDLDESVSIASVSMSGAPNQAKVSFAGTKTLTLTGATPWATTNAVDVAFPIRISTSSPVSACNFVAGCSQGGEVNFLGAIEYINESSVLNLTISKNPSGSHITDGQVHYYGPIKTHEQSDIAVVAPSSAASMHIHGKVTTRGFGTGSWEQGSVYVYGTGSQYEYINVSWTCAIFFMSENAICPTAAINFLKPAGGLSANRSQYDLQGFSQTATCIASGKSALNPGAGTVPPGRLKSTGPVTLTLNGTDDAVTTAAVDDYVTVVWNANEDNRVQEFKNRTSMTMGDLIVKRGVMRVSGTAAFPNARNIRVSSGAVFDIDTDSSDTGAFMSMRNVVLTGTGRLHVGENAHDPFGSAFASIDRDATVDFEGNNQVSFAGVRYGGQDLAQGTYTKDGANDTIKADWVAGDGKVVVNPSLLTGYVWKTAKSGNWSDGSNWAGGQSPAGNTAEEVRIDLNGGDYTVTVDGGVSLPRNMTIGNAVGTTTVKITGDVGAVSCPNWLVQKGGKVEITADGRLVCDYVQAVAGCRLKVFDGGDVSVVGGALVITNMHYGADNAPAVQIESQANVTSKIEIASGTLGLHSYDGGGEFKLGKGGLLDVGESGVVRLLTKNNVQLVDFAGGELHASGTSLVAVGLQDNVRMSIRSGTQTFSGNAVYGGEENMSFTYPKILPDWGREARLRFTDHARIGNKASRWIVGNVEGGRGYFEFDSDATENGYWDAKNGIRYMGLMGVLGGNRGYGELDVSNGAIEFAWGGLTVGGPVDVEKASDVSYGGSEGVVNLSGGLLRVHGNSGTGWAHSLLCGLSVGYGGALPEGFVPYGRDYKGTVKMTGGTLEVVRGSYYVGTGYGQGTVVQSAGTAKIGLTPYSERCHLVVGFAGGKGVYKMTGGAFEALRDAYVGGVGTDVLGAQVADVGNYVDFPYHLHTAQGKLEFSGGVFVVTNQGQTAQMVLGADGAGVIERKGSNGTLRFSNLVLSNTVENVDSGATLRYMLDETGCGPIEVQKTLTIRDNAKLEVDVGDYEPTATVPLVTAETLVGGFGADAITITGGAKGLYKVVQKGTGYYLKPDRGLMVIIK